MVHPRVARASDRHWQVPSTIRVGARVLLLLGALVIAGCGTVTRPSAVPVGPVTVLGQAPAPELDRAIRSTLADLERYWSQQLGRPIAPRQYVLLDTAGAEALPPCVPVASALTGSARYCPGTDEVVIDTVALVPVLSELYSPGALRLAIAHEFGHLVAARLGQQELPQLLSEARADCAAGAFGGVTTDAMALAMFGDFGAPGYGSGADRIRHIQYGIDHGGLACADYPG